MFLNAKNGTVRLKDGSMDYVRFGSGERTLIMLPGLGESLRSMKGGALPMALVYRCFAKDFTVYSFSRKYPLSEGCTTRDLAADQIEAMDALGIDRADLVGVSMGGMISQHLAAHYPDRFRKVVLAFTCPAPNPTILASLDEWTDCARRNDHTALMESNLRRIYSEKYCRKNRWMVPIIGKLTKPASYDRFLIQAQACRTHDAEEYLPSIRSAMLIMGGDKDAALGGEASRRMAEIIPGAKLRMYPNGGHGLYDEEKDFARTILEFLLNNE